MRGRLALPAQARRRTLGAQGPRGGAPSRRRCALAEAVRPRGGGCALAAAVRPRGGGAPSRRELQLPPGRVCASASGSILLHEGEREHPGPGTGTSSPRADLLTRSPRTACPSASRRRCALAEGVVTPATMRLRLRERSYPPPRGGTGVSPATRGTGTATRGTGTATTGNGDRHYGEREYPPPRRRG